MNSRKAIRSKKEVNRRSYLHLSFFVLFALFCFFLWQPSAQMQEKAARTPDVFVHIALESSIDSALSDFVPKASVVCTPNPVVLNGNDGGAGSLRQAVFDACPASTVTFAPGVTTVTLTSAELLIDKTLTVNGGAGVNVTRSATVGTPDFRIFFVTATNVVISGLSISNGRPDTGGGIRVFIGGSLTLNASNVSGNSVTGFGGGVRSFGSLTITNSTISGNNAENAGGIFQGDWPLQMTGSTVSGNTTIFQGSGINLQNAGGTITNSTISGNSSQLSHGGILNGASTATLNTLTLKSCTITNNTSVAPYGAVWTNGSTPNTAVTNLQNTLVAGNANANFLSAVANFIVPGPNALVVSSGHNFDSDGTSGFVNGVDSNLVGSTGSPINAQLAPLANNGGSTMTHALLLNSPALDKGKSVGLTTDQRGKVRPINNVAILPASGGDDSDIGAFERDQTIAIDTVTHNEGNAGTTAYTFSVSLTGPPAAGAPVTVNYSTVDGTAQDDNPATEDNDYQATSGTLTFTSAGPTVQTVTVLVNGDSKFEPNEAFTLRLSNPVNGVINQADGVGTILNDDLPPNFTVSNVTASEGNSGMTPFTFTITRSGNQTALGSTLTYSTTPGTAANADDFIPIIGGTVTFAPNETTKTVVVSVIGDAVVEPTETFTLDILSATNGVVVDGSATGTIVNDDGGLGGLEGDIVDANGGPAGGDGVKANDVTVISQKVINPTTTPPFTASQFQRADVNAPCGNGAIDAGDVTVIAQLALSLIAPIPACGPTTPTGSPSRPENEEGTGRIIRAVNTTAVAGGTVSVSIVLVSLGNEASASYTITFPQATLSNPVVALGSGVPAGTTVLTNANEVAQGRLGILVATPNAYVAGTRQMITVTFNVAATATAGTYPIGFTNSPVGQNVSAVTGGTLLPATYESGNVVIGTTAAGVEVSGRVITSDGRGLRNATVELTDSKGNTRTVTTGSFGNYRFEDVEAGESYVISVTSKRYRFASRVVSVTDSLSDVDFIGQE